MSDYNITLSDGITVINIPEAAVSTDYSVPLIGQNATTYGDDIAAGFLRSLENFAASSSPDNNAFLSNPTALKGQLWYDSGNDVLNVNIGTSGTPNWQQISTTDQGTTTNSMLRWNGTSWTEETQAQLTSAGVLTILNSGLTDSGALSHDGSDFNFEFTNTTNVDFDGMTRVRIQDGGALRIVSTGSGRADFSHDTTDFNIDLANSTDLNITGLTRLKLDSAISLQERASAPSDDSGYGQVWVNTADSGLYYTNDSGTDTRIDVTAGGTVTATSGADNRIAVFSTSTNIEGDATFLWDATTATMTMYNTGNTDSAAFRHDGTDYNLTFTNTTDWNISGLTTMQVSGSIDATGDVEGQSLTIVNTNTFQLTNGAETTFDVNGASALNIRGMDESDTGLNIEDGASLAFEDRAQANPIVIQNTGTGGSTAALVMSSVATDPRLYFEDGFVIRVYDGGNTDYGSFDHDGTDFNIKAVNSTAINIIPTGSELAVEAIANGNTNLYANNTQSLGAWTISGDRTTKAYVVESDSSTQRSVGYNETPTRSVGLTSFTLGREDVSYFLTHEGVAGSTAITCPNDSTIPVGATFLISNDGTTSGTLTIVEGGGVSLYWLDGSGSASASTGTRTLAKQGICTVRKKSNTEYFIWGNGLS